MKTDKNELRQVIAAHSLAETITIFCPKAQILEVKGGACDFTCAFTLHDEISHELMTHMEMRINDHLAFHKVKVMHMLCENAKQFLKSNEKRKKAKELDGWTDGIVSLIQIENYIDVLIEDDFESVLKNPFLVKINSMIRPSKTTYEITGFAAENLRKLEEHSNKLKIEQDSGHLSVGLTHSLFARERKGVFWSRKGLDLLLDLEDGIASCFSLPSMAKARFDVNGKVEFEESCYFTEDEYEQGDNKNLYTLSRNTVLTVVLKNLYELEQGIEKLANSYALEYEKNSISSRKNTSIFVQNFLGSKIEIAKVFFEKSEESSGCLIVFYSVERCLALYLEKMINNEKGYTESLFLKIFEKLAF